MPKSESFSPFSVVSNDFVDAVSAASPVEAEATSVVVDVAAVVELLLFVSPHPVSETDESSQSNVPAVSETAARDEIWFEKLNLNAR